DWTVLRAEAPAANAPGVVKAVDLARVDPRSGTGPGREREAGLDREHAPAWHGTILPKSDADTWLAAAFADYERGMAQGQAINARAPGGRLETRDREQIALPMFATASRYLAAVARRGGRDLPLSETRAELRSDEWYDIAAGKGLLVLAELRAPVGDGPFES